MIAHKFSTRVQMLLALRGNTTVAELARDLGYERSEKLGRLTRGNDAQPSADIIADVANTYVNLSLRWWLTGKGAPIAWGERLLLASEAAVEFPSHMSTIHVHPDVHPDPLKGGELVPFVLSESMEPPPPPYGQVRGARERTYLEVLTDVLARLDGLSRDVAALKGDTNRPA